MISVNCAAIPKDLIESELFGYEKGAFSGADKSGKEGLVEKAAEGTLFLDEVADLSMEAQAKLLRFLEEGEYYRVGGTKKCMAQTRIVAATNKNLEEMVAAGKFRQDLYHRLAVIKIEIPSLNQRREDIVPIAKHYLVEFAAKFGKTFNGISPEAETALKTYKWTGNVRELKNLIERAVLLGDGPVLELRDVGVAPDCQGEGTAVGGATVGLPSLVPDGIDLPVVMAAIEKKYYEESLRMTDGNESRAARSLNVSRDTFRYRRKKLFG
jgi:transcriptional regulator with PAS, ATPase and Fis domain